MKVRLPFGSGLDRYTGIAEVKPGSMADLRNVRPLRGKLQARRGALLMATLPAQDPTDIVVNGGFATDTVWVKGTNWQITGGVASQTAPAASALSQALPLIPGATYELTFTVANRTAGSVTASVGGTAGTVRSTNDTFIEEIVAGSDGLLAFDGDGTWDGDIDDVDLVLVLVAAAPCTAAALIHSVQSQQEGVAVGYHAESREVHVYRTGATGVDPIHLGRWFTLDINAEDPPTFMAAESYGQAFLAHCETRVGRRAPTQVYDALAGTLTDLEADLDGTGDAPVRFRGVESWRNYMTGWGFGNATDVRPEIVRISLPGDPTTFEPDHYFIAGDRGSAVTEVKPAASGLIAMKASQSFEIIGSSELNFGIAPLYALRGCVFPRLALTIEGTCYVWGPEGPWATTISSEGDLEPPLDLERPAPASLPTPAELREGFAVYVPGERAIEWHFGARIYALSLDADEGSKWSYRTRPFAAASGGLLYSGGEVLADSPDVSPTGNATLTEAVVVLGDSATVEWNNVAQDGDETLELWLRPSGGEWALTPPDTAVTLAATQQRVVTVEIGRDYDVAVRYRRGGQYRADFASPVPDDWPATSRISFTGEPAPPVLDSVEWARVSSSVERARISFTPAAGHSGLEHKVLRDATPIVTLPAGTFTHDDVDVTGESEHDYAVVATAYGNDSAASNQVTAWMGPPPPTNAEYVDLGVGGCDPGLSPHDVTWTPASGSLQTEVYEQSVLQTTTAAGAGSAGICADETTPNIDIRHKQTLFGVADYSSLVDVVEA